jgi:glycosyltransferase involved in cell wall biosynthesis
MRLLVVTFGFPPDIGGAETYLGSLTAELARREHQVTVLAQCRGRDERSVERLTDHLTVRRVERWAFLSTIRKLTALGPAERPEILHLHAYTRPFVLQSVLGARRTPIVFSLHGGLAAPPFGHTRLGHAAMRRFDRTVMPRLLPRVSMVIALNQTQHRVLVEGYGFDPKRIVLLPNMLPPDAFEEGGGDQGSSGRFAVLARLSPEKRALDVVRAVAMDHAIPGVDIAGPDGPQAQAIRDTADPLGSRVRLLGPLTGAERLAFLRSARAVVVASEWEGQSTTALEAIAQGTPVVASSTSTAGIPAGTYVEYPLGDVRALAGQLRSLADPEVYERLRRGVSGARGQLMTLENHVDRLLEIYEEAAAPAR